jgi:UDP-2-acetamido-2,6-beta-L-arabino-hexul-4-ose reductase
MVTEKLKKKIGVTGINGFVAYHLIQNIGCYQDEFEIIPFERGYFESDILLDDFVSKCDTIVHLAAVNRHDSQEELYRINVELTDKLIGALVRTESNAHVLISSSSQEQNNNLYGNSKKLSREKLAKWAQTSGANFTGLIIPNVFGPFGVPFYNSVVATFCHQLVNNQQPRIDNDGQVKLIYVGDLVHQIIEFIRLEHNASEYIIQANEVIHVSEILQLLEEFKVVYFMNGGVPNLDSKFKVQLFNTFRSFIDLKDYFPKAFKLNIDDRGAFVEVMRHGISGQTSYSTTVPGITRGNHYHTRKIERFAVIKGKAQIELRKIGSSEVLSFELDGNKPAYVDMPIWYTHNIKNIGQEELLTMFWINEPYDPADPDTYFENV